MTDPVTANSISLYNDYIHGDMSRRSFLERLRGIAGGAAAAAVLLAALEPNWAHAQVAGDDPRLVTEYITYPGHAGPVRAYLARPAGMTRALPGVLVIHENRGLNAHIEDVARRAALAGYLALAPDGLSHAGGGLDDQEAARDRFRAADRSLITADVVAGVPALAAREQCTGRIGTVGFCYGGGVALQCAARERAVAAASCFYGRALNAEETAQLQVPIALHLAGRDARINAMVPEFRTHLDANRIAYSVHMYPDTDHGFHNDTSSARFDADAARLAWDRTLALFARTLHR